MFIKNEVISVKLSVFSVKLSENNCIFCYTELHGGTTECHRE